jgi:hypothetical protein
MQAGTTTSQEALITRTVGLGGSLRRDAMKLVIGRLVLEKYTASMG